MQSASDASTDSIPSFLSKYKYRLLGALYVVTTAGFLFRVSRQPYSQSMKWEQYESVFKGTTLAAAVTGIALQGGLNRRRSRVRDTEDQ